MAIVTVASGDEVASDNHNAIAGWINGTAGYGQPGKLYDFNDPSTYSLVVGNQDTTNGLIQSWQYGAVGAATTVARIRKQGLDGLLLDTGGAVVHLDSQAANGIMLRANQSDSAGIAALEATQAQLDANDAAWNAAMTALSARGGGTLQLGAGVYIGPNPSVVTLIDNLVIRGAGMGATVLKHRAATSSGYTATRPTLNASSRTNVTVCDLAIDGNRTNVNGTTTGFILSELSFGLGRNCSAVRVKFTNFNATACDLNGTNNSAINCWVNGPGLASYTAWSGAGGGGNLDWGGVFGLICSATVASSGTVVSGCVISGCRSNGIATGGYGAVASGNILYDNHRDLSPSASAGGQLAFQAATATAGSRNCVAVGNVIGAQLTGATAAAGIGIEINTGLSLAAAGYDFAIIGNTVVGQTAHGISLDDSTCVLVHGNTIRGSAKSGIFAALASVSTHFQLSNNVVADTATTAGQYGIQIGNPGATGYYSVTGNHLINNGAGGTAHYTDAMGATTRHVWGNVVGSGTAPANYVPTGVTIGAGGLVVTAGGLTVDTATINGTGTTITFSGTSQTQTTVGAAGAASALPGVPRGYIKVVVGATACVVPYWIAS